MEDKLWELFCKTGDIRLYLMYREEYAQELMPEELEDEDPSSEVR